MNVRSAAYWICTGLLGAFMILSSVPDLLSVPQALTVFERLGYPAYLLPLLGIAKLFGVAALLAPRLPRLKEWAYAGFAFDSAGALYSHLYVGDALSQWWGALLGFVLVVCSYIAFEMRRRASRHQSKRGVAVEELSGDAPA